MSDKDDLAAKIKNAYYHARDHGGTMHTAADDAADAILAAGWVHFARQAQLVRAERDALAAAVERVRALCVKWRNDRVAYPVDDPRASTAFIAVKQCEEELAAALAAESSP